LGKQGGIPSQDRYRYSRDAKAGAARDFCGRILAAEFPQRRKELPLFSFFFADAGENDMTQRTFCTPSFMRSRGLPRGFFVSRGYSQGPPA
jgi:hypothetical protein